MRKDIKGETFRTILSYRYFRRQNLRTCMAAFFYLPSWPVFNKFNIIFQFTRCVSIELRVQIQKILMSTIQQVVSKKSESFFCRILSVNCKPSNPNSPHFTAIKTNLRCRNLVRTRNFRSGLFFLLFSVSLWRQTHLIRFITARYNGFLSRKVNTRDH